MSAAPELLGSAAVVSVQLLLAPFGAIGSTELVGVLSQAANGAFTALGSVFPPLAPLPPA